MDIRQNNKRIAEFMGLAHYLSGSHTMYIYAGNNHRSEIELNYHNSWEWLKPVIDKIGEIETDYEPLSNVSIYSDIKAVYKEVVEFIRELGNRNQIKSFKLEQEGVILSTDNEGNEQIQRIDDAEQWMEDNEVEYVKQLGSDEEAVDIVRELVIDNVIEIIYQNLQEGDRTLIYDLLKGEGLEPVYRLTEQELISEAKELGIL